MYFRGAIFVAKGLQRTLAYISDHIEYINSDSASTTETSYLCRPSAVMQSSPSVFGSCCDLQDTVTNFTTMDCCHIDNKHINFHQKIRHSYMAYRLESVHKIGLP